MELRAHSYAEAGKPGLQPSDFLWLPETQAAGLGWYGAAPSVLDFASTRAQRRRRVVIPVQATGLRLGAKKHPVRAEKARFIIRGKQWSVKSQAECLIVLAMSGTGSDRYFFGALESSAKNQEKVREVNFGYEQPRE